MNQKKILLTIQTVLCVLLTLMLAAAVIRIFREGLLLKAADPLSPVFNRERVEAALRPAIPLVLLSLVTTVAGLLMGRTVEKGSRPLRESAEAEADSDAARAAKEEKEEKAVKAGDSFRVLRAVLLTLAVVLIIAGVLGGSARDVFGKAVNICTECIGLG